MKKSFLTAATGIAGVAVFLGVLIAVNAIASNLRLRKDLTREGLYTLSDGTIGLVGKLGRDVTLKFYYSKSAEGLPEPVKQYAKRILDLLREYETHSKGRVVVEVLDPKPDSDDEEWAQRYGLVSQNLGALGGVSPLYLGLVAVSGAKESVIPFFSPSSEPQLEYLVTRMLAEVTTPKKPKIGVMSRLPVMGTPGGMMPMSRGTEPWVFISELRSQYDIAVVSPFEKAIPADIDTLLVIHPKEIADTTLYAIDQFVLRGGRLVAFVDPVCVADSEVSMDQDLSGRMNLKSDLNRLTKAWGYELDTEKVVSDLNSGTRVRMGNGQMERNPTWLSLRPSNMTSKEIATASLDFIMLPFAGAFKGSPAEDLTMTPLLQSAPNAGFVDGLEIALGQAGGVKKVADVQKEPLLLGLRLSGKFGTAFPDGKPVDATAPEAGSVSNAVHLTSSEKDSVVILVADADMLYDRFAVERLNFFGRSTVQLANDNLNFVVNVTEQLSGNEALINLRGRGSYERPFTRVLAVEQAAQARWQEEELKLQEKLKEAQSRLDQLQAAKDPDQQYVISPEQQKEIDAFRKEMFDTRKQLKEVRKNLRSEIEALGVKLKIANIGLMPAAVALFGVLHGLRRRYRATR